MIPSSNQEVVYNTWIRTDSNILIQAVAGSGKTTTLMGILERSDYRTLFLAFNKTIQEEIQSRIEQKGFKHAKAMTLHSLGLLSIRNHYGSKNVVINNNKSWQLMKDLEKFNKRLYGSLVWEERAKISMTIMEMNDMSRIFLTDDMKQLFEFMKQMDKFYFEHPSLEQLWKDFLQLREQTYTGKIEIDFADMIYLVVKEKIMIAVQPYYLAIDEAQDLNIAQHEFIDMLINQGDVHKWISIGDRRQSIYGFSGAYGSSFDLFLQKDNVIELPLDVCYRCPSLIIDEANKVYNVMTGFKQEDGIVEDILNDTTQIQPGSMVICRNSNPLIDLYFQLLGMGMKVFLKGDDILSSITRFLKPYTYKTVPETRKKISEEILRLDKIEKKSDEERFKLWRLKQNYANFLLLITHITIGNDKIEVLLQSLKLMFTETDDKDAITLCTIHKAKGLEADVVYILNEFLIPSKFAKSPMQLEQEKNLKYVARTRAKKELYYLTIKSEE